MCVCPQVGFRQGEEDLYNTLYSSFYGYNSTLDQILDREAYRVVRDGLLGLRHDAHMFHQVRVRVGGWVSDRTCATSP
jgi:hypothetical protein